MKLYITEKSSQIQPLRDALKLENMDKDIEIVALAGHILSLNDFNDYDESLKGSWINLVENKKIPFFPSELKKKIKANSSFKSGNQTIVSNYKNKFDNISSFIEKADEIILATDPDNEGVTLGMEVIQRCDALHKVKGMINMSKQNIENLSKEVHILDSLPYLGMYKAGDSRAYYDQSFGINLSILATVLLGKGNTLQIGGVKLPTIRMVVERDLEFEAHKKIEYFTIKGQAKYKAEIFDIEISTNDIDDNKFKSQEQAQKIIDKITSSNIANVTEYKETTKNEAPPKPYSLTDLQSEANKKYKYGADETLKLSQQLYQDDKIMSYPRTDSNYYAEAEYKDSFILLKALSNIFPNLLEYIPDIENPIKRKIFDDSKIDAHTALSPTFAINKELFYSFKDDKKNIFKLVAVRYFIQFLEDYKFLNITGFADIKNESNIIIKFTENIIVKKGWKVALDKLEDKKRTIPTLKLNENIEILTDTLKIEKGTTKPKPRFSEATLLKAMERVSKFFDDDKIKEQLGDKGIGTPATRANILSQLQTANKTSEAYFTLDKNNIVSTKKARDLIAILPDDVTSPILRANMESKLKDILQDKLTVDDYFSEVKELVTNISDNLFTIGIIPEKQTFEKIELKSLCPMCQNKVIDAGKIFKCSTQVYKDGSTTGCKFVIFKNFRNKDLTISQAESLIDGKKVKLKLKSKAKKPYSVNLKLDDDFKIATELTK